MRDTAQIVIYGSTADTDHASFLLRGSDRLSHFDIRCTGSFPSLQQELTADLPALLVVLTDGAAGMEGVFLARQIMPELPIFWFSNDSHFGMQSHRLDCTYFATKPLTEEKLRKALDHCVRLGIRL